MAVFGALDIDAAVDIGAYMLAYSDGDENAMEETHRRLILHGVPQEQILLVRDMPHQTLRALATRWFNAPVLVGFAQGGYTHAVRTILNYNASLVSARIPTSGNTALHVCTQSLETTAILVEAGGDINAKNVQGYTPLHEASGMGHWRVVVFLLGEGADASLANNIKENAIMLASKFGHISVVKALANAAKLRAFRCARGTALIDLL